MSPEAVLIRKILKRHGARSDLRLWRNETGVYWAGKPDGRVRGEESTVVLKGASRVSAGLCKGSADLIGFQFGLGRFIAIEVKAGRTPTTQEQHGFLDLIETHGGISGIATSVQDVDEILGEPV